MKKNRLFLKLIPTAFFVFLLCATTMHIDNKFRVKNETNSVMPQMDVGQAEAKSSPLVSSVDNQQAKQDNEKTQYIEDSRAENQKQESVNQNPIDSTPNASKVTLPLTKDTGNGLASVAKRNVDATGLSDYDPGRITKVNGINELYKLQSTHDYANNEDHMWVYHQEGARSLKITFDAQTYVEPNCDYIFIYNGNDELLGTYTNTELAGKSMTIWDDTFKIRLTSDHACYWYGFKVIDISTNVAEYSITYTINGNYEGDTLLSNIKYEKKYVENGEIMTSDLTESVRLVWESSTGKDSELVEMKKENGSYTLHANKEGTASGYIKLYEGTSEEPILTSKLFTFTIKPIIKDEIKSYGTTYVNQIRDISLGDIKVREKSTSPLITNVTSSDPNIISVIKNDALNASSFTVKGLMEGKVELTIKYAVKDGDKVINVSKRVSMECKSERYYASASYLRGNDVLLLPTQTEEVTIIIKGVYYNENNQETERRITDLKDITIEVSHFYSNGSDYVDFRIDGDKILITAKQPGGDELIAVIKKDGVEIKRERIYIDIYPERYSLEYNGPTTLLRKQIVEAPVLNCYFCENGTLQKKKVEDAVITCNAKNFFTYNNKTLAASDTSYGYENISFTCTYKSKTYNYSSDFYVIEPYLYPSRDLYQGDITSIALSDLSLSDDYSITWSVKNKDRNLIPTLATLQADGGMTALLSCLYPGEVKVTAIIKRGEETISTITKTFIINSEYQGMLSTTNNANLKVNERASIIGYDYRINSTYYNTSIDTVTSSDPSIVEVMDYSRTQYTNYSLYKFIIKGKSVGSANITVAFTYIDKDGTPVQKQETVSVTVNEDTYSCRWNVENTSGVPGESIPLALSCERYGYNVNEEYVTTTATPSEVHYELSASASNIATVENGMLTFKTDAAPGSSFTIKPTVKINGKDYSAGSKTFYVVSSYYKIQGVTDEVTIKDGDTKTLTPELYQYDKDNLAGKKVKGITYGWSTGSDSFNYTDNLNNEYISATGMSITGSKAGEMSANLVTFYKDESGTMQYIVKNIRVLILPKYITDMEIGERRTVLRPDSYFKITPTTTGVYKIACTNEYDYPVIQIMDYDLNTIGRYTRSQSLYSGSLTIPVTLEGGKTYIIRTGSTDTQGLYGFNTYSFSVNPTVVTKSIQDCNINMSSNKVIYNGRKQEATITIKDGEKTLQENVDYIIEYSGAMVNAGTYNINITGIGYYYGSSIKNFTINRFSLTQDMLQPSLSQVIANGEVQKPEVVVKNGEDTLKQGSDYNIYYKGDFIAIGEYLITITGTGNYSGSITKTFEIKDKLDLTKCTVKLSNDSAIYSREVQKVDVTVLNGTTPLSENSDYEIQYSVGDFKSIGTHTLTIIGKGDYTGSVEKTYVITPIDITPYSVALSASEVIYTGNEQKPTVTVKANKDDPSALIEGTDYEIQYNVGDFKSAGTHTLTIIGKGIYSGSVEKTLVINPVDITGYSVTLSASAVIYTGNEQKPTVTVKANKDDPSALIGGTDYSLSFSGNFKTPGKHTITVTGRGNYRGKKILSYTINKASKTLAFTKKIHSVNYGNQPFTISLSVSSVKTVTYASSNTKVATVDCKGKVTIVGAGKATITALYKGDSYYNAAKASYLLTVSKINNSITASNVVKTCSSNTQTFTINPYNKGKATLTYSSNNKYVSVKSGKVTIAKNFVGTATITIKAASNTNFNAATKTITITVKLAGTKVTSLKSQGKNKFLLKWSKNKTASGYEVQYATNKKFSRATTKKVSKSSTTSLTASKLKSKTTYYVRIRTYKKVGSKTYYSLWSTVRSIKNR